MENLIQVFKALGQTTRLEIVRLLAERDLCVCELTEVLNTSQPRISQHLKVLKGCNLVQERIEGSMRIYHLQSDTIDSIASLLTIFLKEDIDDDSNIATYLKRLNSLADDYRYTK